ncbi:hypothetical protein TGS27_2181 [Geobacillus stearothermophilus]|nr:hypothetical protein TGS27_2181 [Geobacillus stearothermophilus]
MNILLQHQGIVVHDGWSPYSNMAIVVTLFVMPIIFGSQKPYGTSMDKLEQKT